ncbi:MAG: hypothetical protein ACRDWA_06015 [Acidimicrobiia bacterium]
MQGNPADRRADRSHQGTRPKPEGIPKDTNRKRCLEIEAIRDQARITFAQLRLDPIWVAGTTMYWAEGAKTYPQLSMVNTDARALRLFIAWVRRYIEPEAEFVLALHLHDGNVEADAQIWWRQQLELPNTAFTKTFFKPAGTGHRKNRWLHGVCRVSVKRSSNAFHRTMAWIECLAETFNCADTIGAGR